MVDSEGQDILPEYQYYLDNVRLTFTSSLDIPVMLPATETELAIMESPQEDNERVAFLTYDAMTRANAGKSLLSFVV